MARESKQTVTVDIGGTKYRMVTDTDADHLKRLAALVNDRIEKLGQKASRSLSAAQLLAIVSLTMAEELEETERQLKQHQERSQSTARAALAHIESVLADAPRSAG